MTANTEIAFLLKKAMNLPHSNHDVNLARRIETIENDIIEYFTIKDLTFNEAFIDLHERILVLKFLILYYLIKNKDEFKDIDYELNEIIIDVYEARNKTNRDLSFDFIRSIELMRDNGIYYKILDPLYSYEIEKLVSPLLNTNTPNINSIYIDINNKAKLSMEGLSDFYYSSLALDFTAILISLQEEKKLNFSEYKLTQLAEFNKQALKKYTADFDAWKMQIRESELGKQLSLYFDPLNNFIALRHKNGRPLPQTDQLQKSLSDIIELKNLELGWDEEESLPISNEHIVKAVGITAQIYMEHLKAPTFIAPTSNSGIAIEYDIANTRLDIRIEDIENPVINYFVDKKLVEKRTPFSYTNLALIWKTNQTR